MRLDDLLGFTLKTLQRQRFRSAMLVLSLALGVSSTTFLVSLGESARAYVIGEFEVLGSDILAVLPGRKSTTGGIPPITGAAARDITIADALILERTVPEVEGVAALVAGSAPVSFGSRERNALVVGVSEGFFELRRLELARGRSWPGLPMDRASPVAVIGETVERELFGGRSGMGEWIRIQSDRYRVTGVLRGKGDSFGSDLSEAVLIPVASAQQLFNVAGLFRLILRVDDRSPRSAVIRAVEERMAQLHDGELDVTVVNPDALLASVAGILRVMTAAVASIAGVSLLVAGILVMNLTLISVQQRTVEIGLLKAIGASSGQIRTLFITEALAFALTGIGAGLLVTFAGLAIARRMVGELSWSLPWWAMSLVAAVTVLTAVAFAWRPATKAASLSPTLALGRSQ